jgi:methyl-accepting chemotaxis protein
VAEREGVDLMDGGWQAKVWDRAGVCAAGAGGLGGWALAALGAPWWGAGVWAAGTGACAWLLARGRQAPRAQTLSEWVRAAEARPDHPQACLAAEIRDLVGRLGVHGRAIREVVRKLQEHATVVAWVIDTLNGAVSEARESLRSMQEAMARVSEHAAEVRAASQHGEMLVESMGASTEAFFDSAEALNRSVEEATASVAHIHGALSGVQQGVAHLSEASDRNTEFIAQVGQAMGGIRKRIESSLELAQQVETYAERGREVVVRVGEGVDRIRSSSQAMVQSVQALGAQSREIEGVLGIITDVAEETSLLSLNAAILAAQAGEKGAAFGVVADQIRSLARRTSESTKHIETLIRAIQNNITEANQGLAATLDTVEEGRELGREAVEQLELIEGAVAESVSQSRQIAEAAQDQDEKSRAMVSAAGEVNESLHQVAGHLGQSIEEMDRIQALIQSLAALSQSVRAAADEHREAGRSTAELMGSFASRVEGIHSLVDRQEQTAAVLEASLGRVAESSVSSRESLDTIHVIVREMVEESDGLRGEVGELGEVRAG